MRRVWSSAYRQAAFCQQTEASAARSVFDAKCQILWLDHYTVGRSAKLLDKKLWPAVSQSMAVGLLLRRTLPILPGETLFSCHRVKLPACSARPAHLGGKPPIATSVLPNKRLLPSAAETDCCVAKSITRPRIMARGTGLLTLRLSLYFIVWPLTTKQGDLA